MTAYYFTGVVLLGKGKQTWLWANKDKLNFEEVRASMISGYGGGGSFRDSVLGGPTTELDGVN